MGRFLTSSKLSRADGIVQMWTSNALPLAKMSLTSSPAMSADDWRRTSPGLSS
jgi:hypothetical protein